MRKIDNYVAKHRLLSVSESQKNGFSFDQSFYWEYENSRTGGLTRKGNTLTLSNVYCIEQFRK